MPPLDEYTLQWACVSGPGLQLTLQFIMQTNLSQPHTCTHTQPHSILVQASVVANVLGQQHSSQCVVITGKMTTLGRLPRQRWAAQRRVVVCSPSAGREAGSGVAAAVAAARETPMTTPMTCCQILQRSRMSSSM